MSVKPWLSLDEQVALLQGRGLIVSDAAACRTFLQRIGYYHLSGYGRYFQVDPARGDNSFRSGTRFEDISELQVLDSQLRHVCLGPLADVELSLRTGFAYRFAELFRAPGALWHSTSFSTAGSSTTPIHELVLADLDKAKLPFIIRHRNSRGQYPDLPVWVAVEALSFGTLSRAIEHCAEADVRKHLANDLNVAQQGFSSQIRAFVTLRNACAHNNRLWNDVARIQASVPNNLLHRAKKRVGNFNSNSQYQVLVALAQFLSGPAKAQEFMSDVDQLLATNDTFRAGVMNPRSY
ncbi:MAG: Abi family protein [Candidatus Nanopelagicales bacterium]